MPKMWAIRRDVTVDINARDLLGIADCASRTIVLIKEY
jgi:hypothetical protein